MTDLTDDQVRALAHRYRFAKDDHERTIAQTALALLTARAEKAEAESRVWDHAAQIGGDAAPKRIWVSAPNEDNEVETWTDPDEGGTEYILATPEALAASPEVAALIAEARREDAKLLLDAYKGVLVLMRMLDKAGLVAGASAADQISKRIVDAHPEFPGMASLRALKEETP